MEHNEIENVECFKEFGYSNAKIHTHIKKKPKLQSRIKMLKETK